MCVCIKNFEEKLIQIVWKKNQIYRMICLVENWILNDVAILNIIILIYQLMLIKINIELNIMIYNNNNNNNCTTTNQISKTTK